MQVELRRRLADLSSVASVQPWLLLITLLLAHQTPVQAEAQEDILQVYGSEEMISLATGYSQPLVDAPAVATVITAEEIKRLGAITLAQVLETVPGLHVSTARGLSDVFVIRGFFREFNSQVLLLVNGIPVNDIVNGGRPQGWLMPVHDIARVEVIRGPASALYGADALAGVINVVTKTAQDIKGAEVGAYGGSFHTYGSWLLGSSRWGDIEAVAYLEGRTTDGYRRTIKADDQTRIDRLLGTSASLAPGPINTGRDDLNIRIDISQGERWRFRAGYQGFLNVGTGVGTALALDPNGDFSVKLINADFTYSLFRNNTWSIDTQLSYLGTETKANVVPYPSGAFGGLFPQGLREQLSFRVDQPRAGVTATYEGIRNHRIRIGAGVNYAQDSDIRESKNFVVGPQGIPLPVGRLATTDELGTAPFLSTATRTLLYGYLQDEWHFIPDWTLTTGGRIDHYSDFGITIDPRLSLVWNVSPSLTAKALYGRAFRAPSFTELYGNSTILTIGNPNLHAETLNMVQLVLEKRWGTTLWTSIDLFGYDLNNQIRGETNPVTPANPVRTINGQGAWGHGMELEVSYRVTKNAWLTANYAYQTAEDKHYKQSLGLAPEHQFYGEVDWRLMPGWLLNSRVKWIGPRQRQPGDDRPSLDGYTLAGITLLRTDPKEQWTLSLSADNLFNANAREPSFYRSSLPDDIPLPGRSFMAQVRWGF